MKLTNRKPKKQIINTTGLDITNKIILDNNNIKENTYMEILYDKRSFVLNSRSYIKQRKLTYKCINYRKTVYDNNFNKFCNATITAIRNNTDLGKFKFYLKDIHSKLCNENFNILEENILLTENNTKEKNIVNIPNDQKQKNDNTINI